MKIQTVFLDAGGVLVHPNWERVSDTLGEHGIVIDADRLRETEPIVKRRIDTKQIALTGWFEDYFSLVLHTAGVDKAANLTEPLRTIRDYDAEWNLWESIPENVLPTLSKLRELGLRLVVLSNSNGTLRRAFNRLGLAGSIDLLFDSHEEGVAKPDAEFFHRALHASKSSAETTVHVGDFYHIDVIGARNAGIRPILLDAAGLYEHCDCDRVRSLSELPDIL